MTEPDTPNNPVIAVAVALISLTVVATIVGVNYYFDRTIRAEVVAKVDAPVDNRLLALRADEESRLGKYQWVDKAKGVVRIPVERARALVLAERTAPEAAPPPAPAPTPAPTAPAPGVKPPGNKPAQPSHPVGPGGAKPPHPPGVIRNPHAQPAPDKAAKP